MFLIRNKSTVVRQRVSGFALELLLIVAILGLVLAPRGYGG